MPYLPVFRKEPWDARFIAKRKTQRKRLTRKLTALRREAWRLMHGRWPSSTAGTPATRAAITATTAY